MNGRPLPRHYAPELTTPGEPQLLGKPRPGHGTVYVRTRGGTPRYPDVSWEASWVDDFGQPNERGEIAGVEDFEGTQAEVLAWARNQPAAHRLVPGKNGWIPLPDNDSDIRLQGDT